jgi:hypothetical protein
MLANPNHFSTLPDQIMLKLYLKIQSVPRSKCTPSLLKTNYLMLHREIIVVYSQIHTKHKFTVWAERRIVNVELVVHIVTTGL